MKKKRLFSKNIGPGTLLSHIVKLTKRLSVYVHIVAKIGIPITALNGI